MLSLPAEARWLYVAILLSADDVGLFEATEFKLARRADVNRDLAGKLLQLIGDADLVRFYVVDGKRYGFIPHFRQRIQIKRTKHPMPPHSLLVGDSDAIKKFNDLATKTTVVQLLDSSDAGDAQPSEPEPEPEEEKVSDASHPRRQRKADDLAPKLPACPFEEVVALYHEALPEWPRVRLMERERKTALGRMWRWVLTSKRSDGSVRATTKDQALTWFQGYFTRARDNDFLMGRTPRSEAHRNWQPDLDFLLTTKGLKQVIEKTQEAA